MKITKIETKLHQKALAICEKERLTDDEKEFVLLHFHPGASHNITANGVFFTPLSLAQDVAAMHGPGGRVIDACAGIGALSYFLRPVEEMVCLEINPEYCRIGKKIVPEATWICGDIFDASGALGSFDSGISNPPFGAVSGAPQWGRAAHFGVLEQLTKVTRQGAIVILPKSDSDIGYTSQNYLRFRDRNPAFELSPCPIDIASSLACSGERWKEAFPKCEICDLRKCE